MSESNLTVEDVRGVGLVAFRQTSILDALTVERVSKELYELVEGGPLKRFVLDFENVKFIASRALGVLLTLRLKAAKAGATVILSCVRPEFMEIFKLTNLDQMFMIFPNNAAALEHYGVGAFSRA